MGAYEVPENKATPPLVVLLLYHWGTSVPEHVAVKVTTPLLPVFTHTKPPLTFELNGATANGLTVTDTPAEGALVQVPIVQVTV